MKRTLIFVVAAAMAVTGGLLSGQTVQTIQFDSNPMPLSMPDNIHLGEVAGVATNSKGDIFVYTRTGNPTITIGTARAVSHGGGAAVRVRSDRQVHARDRAGHLRIPAAAAGACRSAGQHLGGRSDVVAGHQVRSERTRADGAEPQAGSDDACRAAPTAADALPTSIPTIQPEPPAGGGGRGGGGREGGGPRGPLPGAGVEGESFSRPTDVAWDAQGNIYVADGYGNARVAKYDRNGKWIKNWGSRGTGQGQFNIVHGIAVDAQGNVYVGDEGNKRVQVFDTEGTFKTQFTNVGAPTALCLTRGAQPVLYVAHSGDPDGMDDAAIYKVDLKGSVLGKFGSAGKLPKEFGLVNSIDCRNDNELLVGELANWRVQKLTLRAAK